MQPKVVDFLTSERLAVLTVMVGNERPYSATMHYTYDAQRSLFYFCTDKTSKKAQNIKQDNASPAFLVIGFDEKHWTTIQLDGMVSDITNDSESAKALILSKFPEDAKHIDAETMFVCFKPAWYRYSYLKTKEYIEN